MTEEPGQGINRREFIRRAALTGAAAAWATPVIQTITARPAFAQTGSPTLECHHSSSDPASSCMDVCKASITNGTDTNPNENVDPCNQICSAACPNNCGTEDRLCVNNNFCDPGCWQGFHYTGRGACTAVCFTCPVTVSASFPGTCTVGPIQPYATNCSTFRSCTGS